MGVFRFASFLFSCGAHGPSLIWLTHRLLPPMDTFCNLPYGDSPTTRRNRAHVKSPGTCKERAWGTVSIRMTIFLSDVHILTDLLADVYELGPLEPDSWYTEPQEGDAEDLKCGCNTIIYRSVLSVLSFCVSDESHVPPSLYSACTACQDISPQVWSQWNKNCDAVYVTQ